MICCQPTPYSILQDSETDVFAEMIPVTESHYSEKRAALWARFGDTGIGNADLTYWMRVMRRRIDEIEGRYRVKFRVWTEFLARAESAAEIDLSDGSIQSSSISTVYDPPEINYGQTRASEFVADQNVTEFSQTGKSGLESETVRQFMDAVRNPFEDWAKEFDRLFYWGL